MQVVLKKTKTKTIVISLVHGSRVPVILMMINA